MAFTGNYVCNSFKQELLQGYHDFIDRAGDTFKIALYTSTATLNANTTNYTTTGEVASGGGYTTGGSVLTISASMPRPVGIDGAGGFCRRDLGRKHDHGAGGADLQHDADRRRVQPGDRASLISLPTRPVPAAISSSYFRPPMPPAPS